MTVLVIIFSIWALVVTIGTARQTCRTLRAWQLTLESLKAALDEQRLPTPPRVDPTCPCTCHPLSAVRRS
jgi:hypothetical protein